MSSQLEPTTIEGIKIETGDDFSDVLTPEAVAFLRSLHRQFNRRRLSLLESRRQRQRRTDTGEMPKLLCSTEQIRESDWRVADPAPDLTDRRCEITGPVERKMMINALNSGAKVFMADFEDSASPTWTNMMHGQRNLMDAVRRTISYTKPDGTSYQLVDETATLMVRPRGWHLKEANITFDGAPASASLVDFGLYFFHNAHELISQGSGPFFYLPKLESHTEARLWNDVFVAAQQALDIPIGTIRATVLIETIFAAFEMNEILFELREHSAGLNAGRWDYIFSIIKKFRNRKDMVLPDRKQITMNVPFMQAYVDLLIDTCHRRGAHAMGGMAAFIPSRRDPAVNERAFGKVRRDKEREATAGHDGTWVAHPDLVPLATEIFDDVLGDRPNQIDRQRPAAVTAHKLLDTDMPCGTVTEAGVRTNVDVGIQYIASWLCGNGAAAIYNLMEDAATAEISRSQIWQWIHHRTRTDEGTLVDTAMVGRIIDEEMDRLRTELGSEAFAHGRYDEARKVFERVSLTGHFPECLTLPAYELLD